MTTCAAGHKGGFSKKLFVMAEYAIEIPDKLASEDVGPLFCGGITVYKPIKKYAKAGMRCTHPTPPQRMPRCTLRLWGAIAQYDCRLAPG